MKQYYMKMNDITLSLEGVIVKKAYELKEIEEDEAKEDELNKIGYYEINYSLYKKLLKNLINK